VNQLNFHSLNVLSISDKVTRFIYSPQVKKKFCDVDLIIGCGDLPYYYLEYALNALDVPLLFVRGNHDKTREIHYDIERVAPRGGIDLHGNVVTRNGWIFSGIEGSIRYSKGRFQYTQTEMWLHVIRLVPKWLMNRALFGRSLDVFVSHAPPRSIHDCEDYPHQGIDAFRWLIKAFRPAYFFHGHVHLYRPDSVYESNFRDTTVLNSFGFRQRVLERNPVTGNQLVQANNQSSQKGGR
jgi:Icc-related predicted phosphoesterase